VGITVLGLDGGAFVEASVVADGVAGFESDSEDESVGADGADGSDGVEAGADGGDAGSDGGDAGSDGFVSDLSSLDVSVLDVSVLDVSDVSEESDDVSSSSSKRRSHLRNCSAEVGILVLQ
jgi:hypothetical protein